jgi:DNA-binding MarR family transcriptional regulator
LVVDEGSSMQLVHLLRALTVELDLAAARFARLHQLNGSDLRALIALLDAERSSTAATPGWLSGQLQITSASTTALVDRLTARDLIARQDDPRDRRRTLLVVTETAQQMGEAFFGPLIMRVVTALDTGYDADERAVLRRLLVTLANSIQQPGPRTAPQ